MAEQPTQEPTVESAPAAQEPSAAVVGENQQVQADQSTAPASTDVQPEAANQDTPSEIEEWNGNDVETLPKPLQARARGMLQYLHKVSQEAASVKHLAQAYHEMTNHPEFQEFLQWKEGRGSAPQQEAPVSVEPLSEDDFLAAQTDPGKFAEVHERLLMQKAAPLLQKVEQLERKISDYERGIKHEKAERSLDAFAKSHEDFWKINPVVMKACLEEVVQKKGGSIEEAYNRAKQIEKQYLDQARSSINKTVAQKKNAVTAPPSKSIEPEVIKVKDKREANRIAFEYAKLGKRVDVRVEG